MRTFSKDVIVVCVCAVILATIATVFADESSAPIISDVSASVGVSTATITWTTDIESTSQVEYGEGDRYGSATNVDETLTTSHSVDLIELQPNTLYHYRVHTVNSLGDESISDDYTFSTSPDESIDSEAPEAITTLEIDTVTSDSIELSWNVPNDENGVSVYHLDSAQESIDEDSFYDTTRVTLVELRIDPIETTGTKHIYEVTGLSPATIYYFAIKSADPSGNFSAISNVVFTKTASVESTPVATSTTSSSSKKNVGSVGYHPVEVTLVTIAKSLSATTKDLKLGETNSDIGKIQKVLATDATLYPEGIVSDYFGPLTQAAIERLQSRLNLPVTGVVDSAVIDALPNLPTVQSVFRSPIFENTTVTSADISKTFSHDLEFGNQGDDIKTLQTFLSARGLLPKSGLTGLFDDETRLGVINFQKSHSISPAVGYVGPITRSKILEIITLVQ